MSNFSTPYTSAMGGGGPMQPAPDHASVLRQQDQIIRQQDESLDQLGRSVASLHRMGNEINSELRDQGNLLSDLERGVDQTHDQLISQQSRLKKLIKKSKTWWLTVGISTRTAAPPLPPLPQRCGETPPRRPERTSILLTIFLVHTPSAFALSAVLLIIALAVILYFVIAS